MQNARKFLGELREAVAAEAAAKKRARLAIIGRGRDLVMVAQTATRKRKGTAGKNMPLPKIWRDIIAPQLKLMDELATQGGEACNAPCTAMDKAYERMQAGKWKQAKEATDRAWAMRGGGPCHTGILPRTRLEGTHARSVYAAIRLSTLRGGRVNKVQKKTRPP